MTEEILPIGKLPSSLLRQLLTNAPQLDQRIVMGPGIGLDCAIIDQGFNFLVIKSDPITFATRNIGWYAVNVCVNDIVTTGATPRWFLPTILLPATSTTGLIVEEISQQIYQTCRQLNISVVGGHTEITFNLDRPIIMGTIIGEVEREKLVTPRGACTGDRILMTKGIPIEATAILAREFPERLRDSISADDIQKAENFLYQPGISVIEDACLATEAGQITAMHDPTEGGLAAALWELAEACGKSLLIDMNAILIPDLSLRICQAAGVDPLSSIASGSLLMTVTPADVMKILSALKSQGIDCVEIGRVASSQPAVWKMTESGKELLERPERDEIARLFADQMKPN